MKRLICVVGFSVGAIVAFTPSSHAGGNVNFFLGQKMLDEDDWEPLEDQSAFGAQITVGDPEWPVHIAIDLIGSQDEVEMFGLKLEGSTSELDFGLRKVGGKNKAHPFFGAGVAFIAGEVEGPGGSDDDNAVGYWADAGIFWRLGSRFNLGFEARLSRAEITPFGIEVEGGGEHLGIIFGWGW